LGREHGVLLTAGRACGGSGDLRRGRAGFGRTSKRNSVENARYAKERSIR